MLLTQAEEARTRADIALDGLLEAFGCQMASGLPLLTLLLQSVNTHRAYVRMCEYGLIWTSMPSTRTPKLPLLVWLGLIHYQFEAIHPFLDGNGRIGRLLAILLLIEWGLLSQPWLNLSAYFETHRPAYYDHLLSVSQRGEWENWLFFFLEGIEDQAMDAIARIERLQILIRTYNERLGAERATERLMQAVNVLIERPILSIRQLEAAMGVPYRSAQRYIEKLELLGIIREVTGRARNRLYQADEVLSAFEDSTRSQVDI